jgi:hypothetical protein
MTRNSAQLRFQSAGYHAITANFASRLGEKSMVGWIGRRASFETAALRPPQDEEFLNAIKALPSS